MAAGLGFPDMEATRIWTPEAEGWGSERAFETGFVMGPDPYYRARDGTPQAEDPQALSSPLSVSRSASWRVAGAGTHNAQPGPGGGYLQTCNARGDFARRLPANSHERSAHTGIGLG